MMYYNIVMKIWDGMVLKMGEVGIVFTQICIKENKQSRILFDESSTWNKNGY